MRALRRSLMMFVAGMRQGVSDSDVLCVFLTLSLLNRSFCPSLKDITWALEFGTPIDTAFINRREG